MGALVHSMLRRSYRYATLHYTNCSCQIDNENERLRRAGKDVPADNLSAVGETRREYKPSKRRRSTTIPFARDEMMAAQMSQDYDNKERPRRQRARRRAAEARKKRSEGKNIDERRRKSPFCFQTLAQISNISDILRV